MEKIGPKFSHLLTVRAEGADPPSPPYGQPDRKKTVFFTTSFTLGLDRCGLPWATLPSRGCAPPRERAVSAIILTKKWFFLKKKAMVAT